MKIAIGSDHAGYPLKEVICQALQAEGLEVIDVGPQTEEKVDYPLYGQKVGEAVATGKALLGIAICGSGIGISMAANKVKGIRAALCHEPLSARLAREHNDANVLALGARIIGETMALAVVNTFLNTEFCGGRHQKRVDLLTAMEASKGE